MATRDLSASFFKFRAARRRGAAAGRRAGAGVGGGRFNVGGIVSLEEEEGELGGAVPLDDLEAGGAGAGVGGGSTHASQMAVPPGWMAAVDDVHYDIERIRGKLTELTEAHKRHLLPQFDDSDVTGEQTVEIITAQVTQLFRDAKTRALRIGANVVDPEQLRLRKNLQSSLAQELQSLSMQFRGAQKEYLQSLASRQQKGRQLFSFHDDDMDGSLEPGSFDVEFTDDQQQRVEQARHRVDDRAQEVRALAQSVNEVAAVFRDLATLVATQGTILDTIEHNIEEAHYAVEEGVVQLEKAKEHQKSATKKTLIILLCIMVIVAAVVVSVMGVVKVS